MKINRSFPRRALLPCLLLLLSALARPAEADPVRDYLDRVAADLAKFLKGQNESSIAVEFKGPPQLKSAANNALTQTITDLLKKRGIRVELGTKFGFEGTFKPDEQAPFRPGVFDAKNHIGIALNGKIVDSFGNSPVDIEFRDFIDDERKLFELLGPTVNLEGKKDEERSAIIRASILNPTSFTKDNLVRASEDSRFALGVEVNGELRPIESKNHLSFVGLDLADSFKVRLINEAPFEVAVGVAVDGLSVFHFSEQRSDDPERRGEPRYRYWTVQPNQPEGFAVPGWHKRDSGVRNGLKIEGLVNKFTIAPLEEGAAFKLGRIQDVGTITATFMACWEEGRTRPPSDEVPIQTVEVVNEDAPADVRPGEIRTLQVRAMTRISTKVGEEQTIDVRGVKRVFGRPRATVTIRYERKAVENNP